MLVELLRPAGAELGRRWLACLMLAPESEREAIVESIERRMAELYLDTNAKAERSVDVVHPSEQHEGFVEQKITTYAVKDDEDSVS